MTATDEFDVEITTPARFDADVDGPAVLGATGPPGPSGPPGPPGADGEGVPPGGTTGQALTKASATDFDTAWTTVSTGGTASTTVVTETGFGQSSAAGSVTTYARGDHTHGSPPHELPAGGSAAQVLSKVDGTDYNVQWSTPASGLSALNQGLLATKVWSGTAYVWPGPGGTGPDSNAYTNITFIDPTGTHDPHTSSGGRNVANDLWETGTPSGGGGGSVADRGVFAPSTVYNVGDVVTYGGHHFQRLGSSFTSGSTFDPSNWLALDPLTVDNPATWGAANAADYEFDATGSSLPSGWAWANQGTSTYQEQYGAGKLALPSNASGDNHRLIVRNIPAGTTWTVTAKLSVATAFTSGSPQYGLGLYLRESSTDKIAAIHTAQAQTLASINVDRWNTTAGGGTNTTSMSWNTDQTTTKYLRIRRNSATSLDFLASSDGVAWLTVASAIDLSGFFTYNQVGFGIETAFAAPAIEGACHWLRCR